LARAASARALQRVRGTCKPVLRRRHHPSSTNGPWREAASDRPFPTCFGSGPACEDMSARRAGFERSPALKWGSLRSAMVEACASVCWGGGPANVFYDTLRVHVIGGPSAERRREARGNAPVVPLLFSTDPQLARRSAKTNPVPAFFSHDYPKFLTFLPLSRALVCQASRRTFTRPWKRNGPPSFCTPTGPPATGPADLSRQSPLRGPHSVIRVGPPDDDERAPSKSGRGNLDRSSVPGIGKVTRVRKPSESFQDLRLKKNPRRR